MRKTKKKLLTIPIADESTKMTMTTTTAKMNLTTTAKKKKCGFAVGLSLKVSVP